MSQENVEAFKRSTEAANSGDLEAALEEFDLEVEWRPALLQSLRREATVYRGHEGVRTLYRELDELFDKLHWEYTEIQDLGDRLVAIGRFRMRGRRSGAETEAPLCSVVDFKNGKATRIRTYLDPKDGLEAAGLSE
jgi:ketosteroid isomerase-like protein